MTRSTQRRPATPRNTAARATSEVIRELPVVPSEVRIEPAWAVVTSNIWEKVKVKRNYDTITEPKRRGARVRFKTFYTQKNGSIKSRSACNFLRNFLQNSFRDSEFLKLRKEVVLKKCHDSSHSEWDRYAQKVGNKHFLVYQTLHIM